MHIYFDDAGIPIPTLELILAVRPLLDMQLKKYGVSNGGDDWIHKAYNMVEDFQSNPGNYNTPNAYSGLMSAVHDCCEAGTALTGLQDEEYDCVARKLELLLKSGADRSGSAKGSSRGRDTLFELNMLNDLKHAGIQTRLGALNPDILVHTKKRDYFLECKRLSSVSSSALQRNLHSASKQLKSHLIGKTRGVICLSIGEYLTGGQSSIQTKDDAHTNQIIQDMIARFIEKEGHIWCNNSVVDECVVGVIIYASVLVEQADLEAPVQAVYNLLSNTSTSAGSQQTFFEFHEDFCGLSTPNNGRSMDKNQLFMTYV